MAPPNPGAPRVQHVDGPPLPPRAAAGLAPLLTPPLPGLRGGDEDDAPQYALAPTARRIVVRSARHGRRVCALVPAGEGRLRAAAVAWLPRPDAARDDDADAGDAGDDGDDDDASELGGRGGEWIVLAACEGGTLQEWAVADLATGGDSGRSVGPRRAFRLTCGDLTGAELALLTAVSDDEETSARVSPETALLYGLATGTGCAAEERATRLVRCEIPPFAPTDAGAKEGAMSRRDALPALPLAPLVSVTTVPASAFDAEVAKHDRMCLKRGDGIFGLRAAWRPACTDDPPDDDDDAAAARGDVFVVLCASHGLALYRDAREEGRGSNGAEKAPRDLVQFTELTKPSSHYSKEQVAFSSLAVSPGARDLALGRANGRIEVLADAFANAARYFDRAGAVAPPHPERATVRRTVHWHAHPVRALTFLAARPRGGARAAADPATLLSGGEESVLVTWELDRNSHKPSNFVARVGQGGITHALCCPRRGKVLVFCADGSVQGFDGATYEREWKAQGLASGALHEEAAGPPPTGPHKGPVIMVQDPITKYPMLTNLPGAPGMVHWYNPDSASVVGTLEVAPYNRVSRRDPDDTHMPAPAVTHLAVGQSGKDLITVDTVWTENTSVGAAYGTLNLCTSIKFWAFVESAPAGKAHPRPRRQGEVPRSYELAASMAAPHGRGAEVCALALDRAGGVACTLSREENGFRVWVKGADAAPAAAGAGAPAAPRWKCLYKINTPAGYANLLGRRAPAGLDQQLATFSHDGSVLAVAYGPHVTLWDHANAALLTNLALEGDTTASRASEAIQSVNFLPQHDDAAMLFSTLSQIGVNSPFGGGKSSYLGEDEWSFDFGAFGKDVVVTAAVPLVDFKYNNGYAGGCFAICTVENASKSTVSVVSRDEGNIICAEGTDSLLQWRVDGEVVSLCLEKCVGSRLRLLALTKEGRLLSLGCGAETPTRRVGLQSTPDAPTRAPVLKVGAVAAEARSAAKRRKISIGAARGGEADFDFPVLSGKFTSAFIAKSFGADL